MLIQEHILYEISIGNERATLTVPFELDLYNDDFSVDWTLRFIDNASVQETFSL